MIETKAKSRREDEIRTFHHPDNEAPIALNRRLGYVDSPAWLTSAPWVGGWGPGRPVDEHDRSRRRSDQMKLDDKVVVVTGASRGIGAAVASAVVARGAGRAHRANGRRSRGSAQPTRSSRRGRHR